MQRDPARVQDRDLGARQVPPIHPDVAERAVLHHGGRQCRQDHVLRFIRGPGDSLNDEIGREQFHDVPLVAGEWTTAALPAMPHLPVAEGRLAPLGDPAQNPSAACGRIGLEILPQHGPEGGQCRLQRGRRSRRRRLRCDPLLQAIDFGQEALQRGGLRVAIIPIDVEGRLETRAVDHG